ncbi:RNA-directed DNA polymerase, eukaryota [Tanacetum coccineum]|uniref:RNA-directed DNA polymerase, eukaryota n=1 Tax=Tanacetum coccineum TaxID=301880 RepID=A0ABQ5F3Y2_9ASTR
MVDGEWVDDPCRVKEEFRLHFANRFRAPAANRCKLNYTFPNRLSSDQLDMLESPISRDEVRNAVWGCGENKSPGPDGFTFEFFQKFWDTLGSDFCAAVEWFFDHSSFSRGCNSSFIALIPKNHDPKFVNDYRPISLIGSLYKVVTKILATRLSSIISGLISDVQTAFLPNRQILDGPFIINELLSWCKHKKQQAMVFKVDFAKAYDSIRWDFLEDVLRAFGFGSKWCSWIRGCLHSGMASVLLNGSPTSEFQFHCGLKQGDPLAPYLFILIMESLHLSLSRAIEAGIFKGIKIGSSLNISHLFYADDAVFIGEWSIANLSGITHILHCFSLLSGLSINLKKSHLLGVGIRSEDVNAAALYFGCSTMKTPFKYLGAMVGGNSSTLQAWDDTIGKLKARLSNWKLKTLSVGGRLTLLKSVLGSTPIYNMSIYKVPKSVLQTMESIRRNFFNGVQCDERKIVWIKWAKVLASKKYGGLGVSSFYALNRALLFKWVWRFISRDNSLWCRLIMSMHGSSLYKLSPFRYSTWKSIIREVHMLKDRGVDLISHCHIRVGNGLRTQFWNEVWIGDTQLRVMFPRIYALEINKDCTVADKLQFSVTSSLRRSVRGGVESSQLALLQTYIEGTLLSNMEDRWVWDLNGEGVFRVKDVRILLDECFLPKAPTATRWVKYVPIKINVFAWKVFLDRLPTRSNLQHRGVLVSDLLCPLCSSAQEDSSHLFFSCRLATDIVRLVCRWWNLSWTPLGSYADWLNWFNSIRLSSKVKDLLEGVLYITWWSVWMFRNQLLFSSKAPRKDVIFDDIVSRSFTWCLSRYFIREKAILDLALQFDNACTAKDDLRKAYEKCNDIPQESRALIDTFFKEESDKDYELNLSITCAETSTPNQKPIRIIPSPAGIIQAAKLLKQRDILLGWDGIVISTQEYMKKVVEDVGEDEDFKSGPWVSATEYVNTNGGIVSGCLGDIENFLKNDKLDQVVAIVKSCSPNVIGNLIVTMKDLSGTILGTIHHKVVDEGGYRNDITVGVALILANVSVFSFKPSMHYLNITMRNVVKVFRKNTVP